MRRCGVQMSHICGHIDGLAQRPHGHLVLDNELPYYFCMRKSQFVSQALSTPLVCFSVEGTHVLQLDAPALPSLLMPAKENKWPCVTYKKYTTQKDKNNEMLFSLNRHKFWLQYLRGLQEHFISNMMGPSNNNTKGNTGENICVVSLSRIVCFTIVSYWSKWAATCKNTFPLKKIMRVLSTFQVTI